MCWEDVCLYGYVQSLRKETFDHPDISLMPHQTSNKIFKNLKMLDKKKDVCVAMAQGVILL